MTTLKLKVTVGGKLNRIITNGEERDHLFPFLAMKPIKPDYISTVKFKCPKCGRTQEIEIHEGMTIEIGTIIKPYPGGGRWGKCCFCGVGGLRALEELEKPKKGPVGWRSPK